MPIAFDIGRSARAVAVSGGFGDTTRAEIPDIPLCRPGLVLEGLPVIHERHKR